MKTQGDPTVLNLCVKYNGEPTYISILTCRLRWLLYLTIGNLWYPNRHV